MQELRISVYGSIVVDADGTIHAHEPIILTRENIQDILQDPESARKTRVSKVHKTRRALTDGRKK